MIEFWVPGRPQAWQRARQSGRRYFTAPRVEHELGVIRTMMRISHRGDTLVGPVWVHVTAVFPRPKGTPKSIGRVWHTKRPDLDNVLKLILDGGNKILWGDDSQVVQLQGLAYVADLKENHGILFRAGKHTTLPPQRMPHAQATLTLAEPKVAPPPDAPPETPWPQIGRQGPE